MIRPKILVLYYSCTGTVRAMAEAAAAGAAATGAAVELRRIRGDAADAQADDTAPPFAEAGELAEYDALLFGTPTRFGNMAAPVRRFFDDTGELWAQGALIGKLGGFFTSSATQHGGQESTILASIPTLMHHGMMVVGLPYSFQGQSGVDEIRGGSPYGASTVCGDEGQRAPSASDLDGARFQGQHLALMAWRAVAGKAMLEASMPVVAAPAAAG